MASIVDALVVTLGLNVTGFLAGQNKAQQATKNLSAAQVKAQKELEARNKRAVESFKSVRNEVLALLAIFTAGMGLKEFTEHTIGSAVQLGYMAKNLGMSTQELSAWQRAAERAGGSADGITSALQDSQQQIAKFRLGQVGDQMQAFFRFGGKTSDLKDGNSYLLARAQIIQRLFQVDPGRAQVVAQMMGVSGDQFNFIKQGPQAILALVDAQKKNSAITEQQAAQALKLQNAWLDLRDRLQYVGTTILLQLMPTFELWLQKLQAMADWVADHKTDIAKWVDDAVIAVQKFVTWAGNAADSVGGWKTVLEGLVALKILSMTGNLLGLAGALSSVGGALGALSVGAPIAGLAVLAAAAAKSIELLKDSTQPGHFVGRNAGWKSGNNPIRKQDTNASLWGDIKKGFHEFFSTQSGHFVSRTNGAEQQRSRVAFDYFKSQGWTAQQAAGIVGSLMQESGVDSTNQNKTSGAYGVGQWLGSRVADFKAWSGHDLAGSSLQEQLAFMQYELTKGKEQSAGNRLRAAKTAADAAAIHSQFYERPGQAEANIGQRQAYANSLYASLGQANASQIAGQSAGVRGPAWSSAVSHMTTTAETNINGPITIQTQATDAQGIAREFGKAVAKYSFTVPQANTGLT